MNDAGAKRRGGEDGAPSTQARPARSAPEPVQPLRRIDSAVLLAGAREIEIQHRGELYRLRCTSKGKLILTK